MFNNPNSGYVVQKPLLDCNLSVAKFIAINWYELGHTVVLLKSDLDVQ